MSEENLILCLKGSDAYYAAQSTKDAFNNYINNYIAYEWNDWLEIAQFLEEVGFSRTQIIWMLHSNHMRWCNYYPDPDHSVVDNFKEYCETNNYILEKYKTGIPL